MGAGLEGPTAACAHLFLPVGSHRGETHRGRGTGSGGLPPRAQGLPLTTGPSRCPNLVVHRDAVGPADADINQHHPLSAIQPRPLDTRVLAPLGPEQVPVGRGRHAAPSPEHGGERPLSVWAVARVTGPGQSQEWGLARLSSSSPLLRVNSDGPGLVQTLGDDHVAERAIEPGDLDDIEALVGPVDVA